MTDPELKNFIARIACSGIPAHTRAFERHGLELTECDVVEDGSREGMNRTVQVTVRDATGWPRVFEFTVREVIG